MIAKKSRAWHGVYFSSIWAEEQIDREALWQVDELDELSFYLDRNLTVHFWWEHSNHLVIDGFYPHSIGSRS